MLAAHDDSLDDVALLNGAEMCIRDSLLVDALALIWSAR